MFAINLFHCQRYIVVFQWQNSLRKVFRSTEAVNVVHMVFLINIIFGNPIDIVYSTALTISFPTHYLLLRSRTSFHQHEADKMLSLTLYPSAAQTST